MRPKSIVLLILAAGCATVLFFGFRQLMAERGSADLEADREAVCVVSQEIGRGTLISKEMVRLERWPKDVIPPQAIKTMEGVLDQRAKDTLLVGQPILEGHLGAGGAAPEIPLGKRLIPIQVDDVKGVAQMIQPGDHVDVLVLLEEGRDFEETTVTTILQNVTIFAVDSKFTMDESESGRATRAKTVTLELTPREAQIVAMASDKGRLQLVLRHPKDNRTVDIGPTTPPMLRQLDAGDAHDPDPVVSILAEGLAGVVASVTRLANPDAHSVCVVVSRIDMGEPISADKVRLERWAGRTLPKGAIRNLDDIIGCRARGNMFGGELILADKLIDYEGGAPPVQIKDRYRVIPIEVTEATGIAGMLHPGDHVDVYLFVKTEGKTERGDKVENMHVTTILQDVLVFAVGDTHTIKTGEEGKSIQVNTVSLELSAEDAQMVALASGIAQAGEGSLQLSLRHPEDAKQEELSAIDYAGLFAPMFMEQEDKKAAFQPTVDPVEETLALTGEDMSGFHVVGRDFRGKEISNQVFADPNEQRAVPTESEKGAGSQTEEPSTDRPSGSFWNWGRSRTPDADENSVEDQDETEITPSEDEPESPPDATIDLRVGARQGVDRG